MSAIPWLDPYNEKQPFPPPGQALEHPNGLLAVGGNLSPGRLLRAYHQGIFPWFADDDPICWWSPNPRTVLFPDRIKISRSLRKTLKKPTFQVTADLAFNHVIEYCSGPRDGEAGTWITDSMKAAYCRLHRLGYAHSIETWGDGELVGGLYGVSLGGVFYGESMFSRVSDASKIALVALCKQLQRWGFGLIDCQLNTQHLIRMGAEDIPRTEFMRLLDRFCRQPMQPGRWQFDADLLLTYGRRLSDG